MNRKQKFSIKKNKKYLHEVSVVLIGAVIMLSASYWISQRGKKELSLLE